MLYQEMLSYSQLIEPLWTDSWEWNWCAQTDLHFKKKNWGGGINHLLPPKSSNSRKKPPHQQVVGRCVEQNVNSACICAKSNIRKTNRAATKLLHPCLSRASLLMVPLLWFIFFISASLLGVLFMF